MVFVVVFFFSVDECDYFFVIEVEVYYVDGSVECDFIFIDYWFVDDLGYCKFVFEFVDFCLKEVLCFVLVMIFGVFF